MYIYGGGESYATTSLVQALRHECIYLCDLWLYRGIMNQFQLDTRANDSCSHSG